jgi:two-component system, OmpR family, heavy metal sensor histidine kinase CusS
VIRLSIGAKWTLRYTAVMLLAVSLLAAYTYWRIDQRFHQDARFLVDLQLKEVVETLEAVPVGDPDLNGILERNIEAAGPDLKLGIQIFDAQGNQTLVKGSLEGAGVGLPDELPGDLEGRVSRDIEFPSVAGSYPYLVLTRRLPGGGAVQGAVYLRRFVRNARGVRDIYLWTLPLAVIFTLALGSWLVRGSLRPIAGMTRTARRISGTHLEETVPTTGSGDELDELATTLNQMVDRIRHSVERMQRFSANAAHELRTPLNALRSRLEVTLEQERTPDEYRKALAETAEQVVGLSEAVHAMMRLSQSEAGLPAEHRTPVAVAELLHEVVDFFEPLAAEQGLRLSVGRMDPAVVSGEPAWLHQCFANLLDNAIRYTPEGGAIRVELELSEDGTAALVRVADTGIGIEPHERERIFEPYHRVRAGNPRTGPGAGIGLALAREIARAHGGDVSVESRPGEGSTFTVQLPLAAPA